MSIQSDLDFIGIQQAGEAVAVTLRKMRAHAQAGMSTKELDEYGFKILKEFGAIPAPKFEYGFPGWTCISVNHEVAHGIPSKHTILQEGDLVNIDVSARLNDYYGDNGSSFVLGKDIRKLTPLVQASQNILHHALDKIKGGVRIALVGKFIEQEAKQQGFTVIRNLLGHGIGRKLHEAPFEIPCYYDKKNKQRFKKNSVVAIETFISTKAKYAYEKADGWTLTTPDQSYVAQHEHTIIVTDDKPLIITEANGI